MQLTQFSVVGIDAGFEGRVPEIGMNFKTTTDAAEACPNSENPSAIHVTRDLSCAFLVFGGLNDQTPWNHQLAVSELFLTEEDKKN